MKDVPPIVDRVEMIAILGRIVSIVTTVHNEGPKPRGRKLTVIVKEKLHQNHFASKRKKLLTTNRHRQTIPVPVAPLLPPVQIRQVHQAQIHLQTRTAAVTNRQKDVKNRRKIVKNLVKNHQIKEEKKKLKINFKSIWPKLRNAGRKVENKEIFSIIGIIAEKSENKLHYT